MRRFCNILLCAALAMLSLTCGHKSKGSFDMQRELGSLGVSIRKITLNPSMLTPFLDDKNSDEAALKNFLRSVAEVSIFSLPTKQVLDSIASRAKIVGYRPEMSLRQKSHRMWVYALPTSSKHATKLVVLLQSDDVFYGIEVSGSVDSSTLASLSRISPTFFESYIRRFNVKF